MEKLKIGLIGCSQLSFPGDKAAQFARSAQELNALGSEYGYELYVHPNTVITGEDAHAAVKACEAQRVDFLMVQCTSYSSGFIVPTIAKARMMGLGLWAIPEGVTSGVVPFNSFCGVNMYSAILGHYMKNYNIRFKWFFGNRGDAQFDARFRITVHALKALKRMKNSKVALIGGVAPGFNDLLFDERKLLGIFDGIAINRLHEYGEIKERALKYSDKTVKEVAGKIASCAACVSPKAERLLEISARFYLAYTDFAGEHGYDALAVSCWPAFQKDFEYSVCSVLAQLNEEGVVAACEGDLPSAICMLLLKYLSGDVTTLMDLIAYDEADNTVCLWHCGPTAKQFCRGSYNLGLNYSGAPHEFGMKDPTGIGITRDMVFHSGAATVARLDAGFDNMLLFSGDLLGREKDSLTGSRGWMENLKLAGEPIKALDIANTILVSRFPHHYPLVYGDFTKEILELSAWLGLGLIGKVPYQEFLQ